MEAGELISIKKPAAPARPERPAAGRVQPETGPLAGGRRLPAVLTVEAALVMAVVFFCCAFVIRFAFREHRTVADHYDSRVEEMIDEHREQLNYQPEEYMRAMTLWEGIRDAYTEKEEQEND